MRRTLGGTWTPISQAFSRTSRPVSPRRRTTWSLGNCQLNKNIKAYTYLATYMHAGIHTYARAPARVHLIVEREKNEEKAYETTYVVDFNHPGLFIQPWLVGMWQLSLSLSFLYIKLYFLFPPQHLSDIVEISHTILYRWDLSAFYFVWRTDYVAITVQ